MIISHDSKKSKEPKNQKSKATRTRRGGEPSCYGKPVNKKYHKEVMTIPEGKAGLIIGKRGWRIKDIKEQTGVKELNIRDDQVHIRGTEEQCSKAKKIIDMILKVLLKSPFSVFIWKYVPLTDLPNSSPPSSVVVALSLHFFLLPRSFLPSLTSLLACLFASCFLSISSFFLLPFIRYFLPPPFLHPYNPSFFPLENDAINRRFNSTFDFNLTRKRPP